ncbi:hypothetical protein L6164_031294 [Bauhinia variegata]|uniref:Uncharacterized protein n=1 Tax=Bauhinia variegata TaxID=167791 RepID=A0ACB9LFW5_BAUVA|nr:hypothetical protein L6164_031294 [Bauhinia variegata]
MEDLASTVVVRIAELLLFKPTFRHARYLLCLGKFVKGFKNQKRELESKQESVKERVRRAINRLEEPEEIVKNWQQNVDNVLKEAQELERKIEARSKCKTTLAKELGKRAEELGLFDKVVIAAISHTPNARKIQDHILDVLGLRVEEQSEFARAQRLPERLRKGKTLVILDDVSGKLDFEAIGIPWNHENGACSILITTRRLEVCSSMHCRPAIELLLLTKEESWTWFRQCADIKDDSPRALSEVARKICDKCQGLPIAILTVGSTLRGKAQEVWEHAMSKLGKLDVGKGLRST